MGAAEQIHYDDMPADLAEKVKARLMAACDTDALLPVVSYRQRLIRGSRPSQRATEAFAR